MALTDKLTSIADAIRTQTDTTDKMTLDEMPEKISKLGDVSTYFAESVSETYPTVKDFSLSFPKLKFVCKKSNEKEEVRIVSSLFSDYRNLKKVPEIELTNYDYDYVVAQNMFYNCTKLNDFTKMLPFFDNYKLCDCQNMFAHCDSIENTQFNELLKHITLIYKPEITANSLKFDEFLSQNGNITEVNISFDTSQVTSMRQMLLQCRKLKIVSAFDCSSVTDMQSIFQGSPIETFGGFINLGKNLKSLTRFYPSLPSSLSHTSLLNILNGLYDISNTDAVNSNLNLGNTLLSKLSDEEKKIATDKGWILS